MIKLKKPLLFALSLLPFAVVGGIFVGFYQLETATDDVVAEIIAQFGNTYVMIALGAVQAVAYAFICGFFGYIFAEKLGLWKPVKPEKKGIIITLALSLLGGIVFSLDYWIFGNIIDGIQNATKVGLTINSVIASVLYGGIIEEVMLRLFFMSLIAFIIWRLFFKKYDKENVPTSVFIIANVVAAILFSAGHLPATLVTFGELTAPLIIRCFLMNGGLGLLFGWLYRKYGIVYAMTGHALVHIVSKLIWLLFI